VDETILYVCTPIFEFSKSVELVTLGFLVPALCVAQL